MKEWYGGSFDYGLNSEILTWFFMYLDPGNSSALPGSLGECRLYKMKKKLGIDDERLSEIAHDDQGYIEAFLKQAKQHQDRSAYQAT